MDDIEASIAAAKTALRDQLVTYRGRLGPAVIAERARQVADVLAGTEEVRRAATVAAYVSVGREPGTGPLLDRLTSLGKRVILPLLQPDNDLDWGLYRGPGELVSARRGLLEPAGAPLGPDAVATADLVVVPGMAVDRSGMRLGRGGGSYDRALGRVTGSTVVVLNSEEVLDVVPGGAHDRRVGAVVTEEGLVRFDAGPGGHRV